MNGSATAIYLGTTRVLDSWEWDGGRLPSIYNEDIIQRQLQKDFEGIEAFDLKWLDAGS